MPKQIAASPNESGRFSPAEGSTVNAGNENREKSTELGEGDQASDRDSDEESDEIDVHDDSIMEADAKPIVVPASTLAKRKRVVSRCPPCQRCAY